MQLEVFLIKKYKYPSYIIKKKLLENLYGYLLEKGTYFIDLNYSIYINNNSSVPDYIKYSCLKYLMIYNHNPKIIDFINNEQYTNKEIIFQGFVKSNTIKLIVK
jgi:hypothetical protein